ncbi:MAG: DUF4190 domain-containing protein [Corynebacterium sp.]|nr:DUF4190 domain-containing protein [Corynebacterium sp.]
MTHPNNPNPNGQGPFAASRGENPQPSSEGIYPAATPEDSRAPYARDEVENFGGTGYQESEHTQYTSYPAAGYQEPVKKSTLAVVALVLGVIALLTSIFMVGGLIGLVGIIVAIVALVRNRRKPQESRRTWMSVTGLVLSIIATAIAAILISSLALFLGDPNVQECIQNNPADAQACINSAVAEMQ